jgi:DNA-binding PadR family transcriptional regulator
MELSSTAYVILGMLDWRPLCGYEIKALVDRSTRLFWTASYGQIYPELRRLSEAGLIEGESKPRGGRKRTMFKLTPAGRVELRAWLAEDPEVFETRDEAMLKLFFAGSDRDSAPATLDAKRRHHEEIVSYLRGVEDEGKAEGYSALVVRYGIEVNEFMADWCRRATRDLEREAGAGEAA